MTQADSVHSTPPTNTSRIRRKIPGNNCKDYEGTPDADLLRVGSLELDLVNRRATRGGRSLDLLPREFRLLEYMMQRCGQVLTRAKLFEDVWNYKFVPEESNLVDVHMGKLRRKVDGPNDAPMICSVRGAGFILNATDGVQP
jgi:two-component system, OmpR family, response regulator